MAPLHGDQGIGIRSRNFSKLQGHRVYTYEYFYSGPFCSDIMTSCTIFLDVADSTVDSYRQFQPKIFKNIPPDATFELYSLFSVFHSPEELQRSVYLRLDEISDDYRSVFLSSEIVQQILSVLSPFNLEVISFYFDFTFKQVDDELDLFDFYLCLG